MGNVKQFWQECRHFLIAILKERIHLSKNNFRPDLLDIAELQLRLIEENGYCNNQSMASYLIRKYPIYEQLVPQNEAHASQMEKLNDLLIEAHILI